MREFVVSGHEAPTTGDFSLDALPGEAGRLDLLARSLVAALLTSHGIREDVQVSLVLADEYTLRVDGSAVRNLHPDERSTAALVRAALDERDGAVGQMEVETSPGVFLSRRGFETVLAAAAERGTVVRLHEEGEPIGDVPMPGHPVFVLSDHRSLTEDEEALVAEHADTRVSLGPRAIHTDQAIAVAHNVLDSRDSSVRVRKR